MKELIASVILSTGLSTGIYLTPSTETWKLRYPPYILDTRYLEISCPLNEKNHSGRTWLYRKEMCSYCKIIQRGGIFKIYPREKP